MKIAISSDGENLTNKVDQRFGRCPYFIIAEIENNKIKSFTSVKNEGNIQGHGAGIKAGEQMGNLEVDVIITGQLGPNATNVLTQLDIKCYNASGVISDAIHEFISKNLNIITDIAEEHNGVTNNNNSKTNEKIFFPLLNNDALNSKISEHFGHAPFFGLYDVDKKDFSIVENNLNHTDANKTPIDQIQDAVNPTTIFAKGIGGRAINLIKAKGLKLKTGNYNTVKDVLDNLNNLEDQIQDCGHEH